MRDFAFYNAGVHDATGPKRVLGLARRLIRRVLRPMFYRQEAIYREFQDQIDQLSDQVRTLNERLATTDAFGWDYVAMSRRMAAIEDHLASAKAGHDEGRRVDPANTIPTPHVGGEGTARDGKVQDSRKSVFH